MNTYTIHRFVRAQLATAGLMILCATGAALAEDRTFDGTNNNLLNTDQGSAATQLQRMVDPAYDDGISDPSGASRPNPRDISNAINAQSTSVLSARNLSAMVFQWGQFIDHDIDLTPGAFPSEPLHIDMPLGEPLFDPFNTGVQQMSMNRSIYDTSTGTDPSNPRQQMNMITSYIDASNVYGSDQARADALRTFSGGKLKVTDGGILGDLLPFNLGGTPQPNDNGPMPGADPADFFMAGDIRANEQTGLTAMHTLFVREHNRIAEEIESANPGVFSDAEIYAKARKIVGGIVQSITYNEFLPALLGGGALDPYSGYDETVDASIANIFSTAAFRVGHTMLTPELLRVDINGVEIAAGGVALRDAFFNPSILTDVNNGGIDAILRGLTAQTQQEIDVFVVDDVRNFLFGPPGAGGFDLASLNIQRGRDHGLPDFNTVRIELGLGAITDFTDITSDLALATALQSTYGSIDLIDAWIGMLAEDHVDGASVGETIMAILKMQFEALRDGDRFFFMNDDALSDAEKEMIAGTTLFDVLDRNLAGGAGAMLHHTFFTSLAVPEPTTLVLGAAGLAMLARRRRRRIGLAA